MHEHRSGPLTGFAPEQEILSLLREMPFASVSDLAARHELEGISRATVNHHLQWLYLRDYVGLIVRGWSQRAKRRYYLHSKGIDAVMAIANEPLEWGMTETALRRLLRQGQLLEMMYDTAPRLFSSNAVSEAWRLNFPLVRLQWVSRGPIAALAEYQYDPCGDELVPRLMVPYVWYGNRPKPNPLPRDLTEWFSEITANPGAPTGTKIYFCGIVILAADRLSGMRSRKDLEPSRPRALVTSGNACGGSLIEAMELIPTEGSISNAGVAPAHPGQPERIETEYIVQDPIQANVLGKTDHKVLTTVEEWPGCSTRQLARLCGHPPSKVRGTIDRFVKAGLMERNADGTLYPTELILKLAEDRDRLGHRKTRGRAGAERSPGGGRRAHMSRHESGVVELAIRFKRELFRSRRLADGRLPWRLHASLPRSLGTGADARRARDVACRGV